MVTTIRMISIISTITLAKPIANDYNAYKPSEGQALKCSSGGDGNKDAVFRFTQGKLSVYPNPTIASSWDANWSNWGNVDCTKYEVSTPMIQAPAECQAVKCSSGGNGNNDSVYRFTNKQIRWYPNPTIATSYDPTWGSFMTIDCTNIVLGSDMPPKA